MELGLYYCIEMTGKYFFDMQNFIRPAIVVLILAPFVRGSGYSQSPKAFLAFFYE